MLCHEVELLVGMDDVGLHASLLRRSKPGSTRRERLCWECTHQLLEAIVQILPLAAYLNCHLGQFHGIHVDVAGLVERVDNGACGESGLG